MKAAPDRPLDVPMQRAVDELEGIIRRRYPEAQFQVSRSPEDPAIVHLITIVDVDDTDRVLDLIIDRQIELQSEEELPIFVVTERPRERVGAMRQEAAARRASGIKAL